MTEVKEWGRKKFEETKPQISQLWWKANSMKTMKLSKTITRKSTCSHIIVKLKTKDKEKFVKGARWKEHIAGTSLVAQWLRLHTASAGGAGLIPDQGSTIPHATQHSQKIKKTKQEHITYMRARESSLTSHSTSWTPEDSGTVFRKNWKETNRRPSFLNTVKLSLKYVGKIDIFRLKKLRVCPAF